MDLKMNLKKLAEIEDQINELRKRLTKQMKLIKKKLIQQVDELILKVREITAETLKKFYLRHLRYYETARRFLKIVNWSYSNEFDECFQTKHMLN